MKKIIYVSLVSALLLGACAHNDTATTDSTDLSIGNETVQLTAANTETIGSYEDEDFNTDASDSQTIELSDTTKDSDGVTVDNQTVTITKAGTYTLTGELTNGQIIVNVSKEEKVHLILDGVTITNESGPAILIEQAEKVITTLADNSTTTLTDGSDYQLEANETEPDATFFSKEDLVINGEGELVINGNYSNGIRSKDDLILISGNYTINAKNNALKSKDSVQIKDGLYTLTTEEGDGIQANNTEDETKGFVAIDGGSFLITSGRDGIQAETNVTIQQADITIQTGEETISTEESYKGIKAGKAVTIQSGTLTIDSADDSLNSNGDITIAGGELKLTSADDGIHTDNNLTIDGGTIAITDSYEGLEASVITLNDGEVSIVASNDGVNAGGGSDTASETGTFGADSFDGGPGGGDQTDESKQIIITGGTLAIDAQGDGLDSNGNIQMSGGTLSINGPTENDNGALDYNGTFELTGGTLASSGSNGMAMNVSEASTQPSFGIYFDNTQTAGTIISLQDSSGNVVVTYQPNKDFQHLTISSADLKIGETYTLISGTEANGTVKNGLYEEGIINGIELGTLTLSDTVTNVTETGEEASQTSMMGNPREKSQ
jgi:hypothetical protein